MTWLVRHDITPLTWHLLGTSYYSFLHWFSWFNFTQLQIITLRLLNIALLRCHHHRHHYFSIPRLLPSLLNYQIDYQLDIKLAIMPTLILYLVNFHTLQYPQHYQHNYLFSLGQYVVQPHQSKTRQGIWHHKSLANVIPCSHGSTSWVSWRVGDAAYHSLSCWEARITIGSEREV